MLLGLLTSGGDAPGMNALVHGFREACLARSIEAFGIRGGFGGVTDRSFVDLADPAYDAGIVARGGTVIGTGRRPDLRTDPGVDAVVEGLGHLALDGLAVAGGSGTRAGVERIRLRTRVPIVFVPATIDADVPGSDSSIGFESAVDHGVRALDDLRSTASSLPGRAYLVEVLGANCGRIAEAIAAATPVDALIVPERPVDLAGVAEAMRAAMARQYAIAVMTEGCGEAGDVAHRLAELIGARVRPTVLGHGQRGTAPNARDRALGLSAGRLAAEALADGRGGEIRIGGGGARFVGVGA